MADAAQAKIKKWKKWHLTSVRPARHANQHRGVRGLKTGKRIGRERAPERCAAALAAAPRVAALDQLRPQMTSLLWLVGSSSCPKLSAHSSAFLNGGTVVEAGQVVG